MREKARVWCWAGRRTALALALATAVMVAPRRAQAQTPPAAADAAVDRLVQMNEKALNDYDTLEFESAKRTLLEALLMGKKAGLDSHPMLARTYVHLGAVYITGYQDRQKGLQSFIRALEIDPTITIQKSMLSGELSEVFAQAAKQAQPRQAGAAVAPVKAPVPGEAPPGVVTPPAPPVAVAPDQPRRGSLPAAGGDVPPPPSRAWDKNDGAASDEPDLPVHINALDCPVSDESPPGKAVPVRCAASPELGATSIVLFYREPGAEDYVAVGMKKTPKGWFTGRIPKKAVSGKAVQFYFEARDATNRVIASNGRSESPNLVLIREGGDDRRRADEDENPLDDMSNVVSPFGHRRWWIGLMAGTGVGYASGDGPEARTELRGSFLPGLAWSSLGHLAPEIGVQLSTHLALTLQGRNQYIPQSKKYERYAATGAQSVLLRLLVMTGPRRVRFYGAAMAGGGEGFRLVIYPDPNDPNFKDTVRGGPGLAGVGLGVTVELASSFSLVLEFNELLGFPKSSSVTDGHFGFQLNIN